MLKIVNHFAEVGRLSSRSASFGGAKTVTGGIQYSMTKPEGYIVNSNSAVRQYSGPHAVGYCGGISGPLSAADKMRAGGLSLVTPRLGLLRQGQEDFKTLDLGLRHLSLSAGPADQKVQDSADDGSLEAGVNSMSMVQFSHKHTVPKFIQYIYAVPVHYAIPTKKFPPT